MEQWSRWQQCRNLEEGSPQYEDIGRIVDAVAAGYIPDPTGGATFYYSPQGMAKLVADGHQTNEIPAEQGLSERGHDNVTIGGHVFTGLKRDSE